MRGGRERKLLKIQWVLKGHLWTGMRVLNWGRPITQRGPQPLNSPFQCLSSKCHEQERCPESPLVQAQRPPSSETGTEVLGSAYLCSSRCGSTDQWHAGNRDEICLHREPLLWSKIWLLLGDEHYCPYQPCFDPRRSKCLESNFILGAVDVQDLLKM